MIFTGVSSFFTHFSTSSNAEGFAATAIIVLIRSTGMNLIGDCFSFNEMPLKIVSISLERSDGRACVVSNNRTRLPANVSLSNREISSIVRRIDRAESRINSRFAGGYAHVFEFSPMNGSSSFVSSSTFAYFRKIRFSTICSLSGSSRWLIEGLMGSRAASAIGTMR